MAFSVVVHAESDAIPKMAQSPFDHPRKSA